MMNDRLALTALHRTKLAQLQEEANSLSGTALKIAQSMGEVIERGGATASIQPQMAALTGILARMIKDWGVVEHLQSNAGIGQRIAPPPQVVARLPGRWRARPAR